MTNMELKKLKYYKLRKNDEDRQFIRSTKEGYFNLFDQYLILKIEECDRGGVLLVNRTNKIFIN
mgnify:CR=1 FL=1